MKGELNKEETFYSKGLTAFGEGVTSNAIVIGHEENIFFDKRTKARISLLQDEIDENNTRWIIGNIDFVIIVPDFEKYKAKKREIEYTVLRIKFDLRYQLDTLEIISFDVFSDCIITDVNIIQERLSPLTKENIIVYGIPLKGEYHINFWNTTWGCAAKFAWIYEITLNENGEVILALQQLDIV